MTTTGQSERSSFEDVSVVLDQLSAWLDAQALATRRQHNGSVTTQPTARDRDRLAVLLGARAVDLVPRLLRLVAGIVRVLAIGLRAAGRSSARTVAARAAAPPHRVPFAGGLVSRGMIRSLGATLPAAASNGDGDAPGAGQPAPAARDELVEWVESVEPPAPPDQPAPLESPVPPEPWVLPVTTDRSPASSVKRALPVLAIALLGWAIWRRRRR